MSKAKLIFNLPDEAEEFEHASKGSDWRFMVQCLDSRLRDALKYNDSLSVQEMKGIQFPLRRNQKEERYHLLNVLQNQK